VLQHFAADVEGQILGIDDALQEAQIARQDFGAILGDEDPAHIELQAMLALGMEQIHRPRSGHEEDRGIVDLALGPPMDGEARRIETVADEAIELGILLGGDVRLGPKVACAGQCLYPGLPEARVGEEAERHGAKHRRYAGPPPAGWQSFMQYREGIHADIDPGRRRLSVAGGR